MKKWLTVLSFLALTSVFVHCQGLYFKAGAGYNLSVCDQVMPDYLSHHIRLASGSGFYMFSANLEVTEFSVASGPVIQAAAGYSLDDFISLELRFSTFTNSLKEFEATPRGSSDGMTEWKLQNLSIMPTILLGQTYNRVSLNVVAWSGVGATDLNITTSFSEDHREFEFDRQAVFSWGYGLEFSYAVTEKFSLFANTGINNSYYRPHRASLISSSIIPAEYLDTYQKEIVYVDEITSLDLSTGAMPVPTSPDTRLNETLRLNSLSGSLGIKFSPWK